MPIFDCQKSRYGFTNEEVAFFGCHILTWLSDHPDQKKIKFSKKWFFNELGFRTTPSFNAQYNYAQKGNTPAKQKWARMMFDWLPRFKTEGDTELIELCRKNKVLMMLRYFPQRLPYKWFHLLAMKILSEKGHTLLLMPMSYAKSTISCVVDAFCDAILNPDIREKVIGSNQDFGKKWTWTINQMGIAADMAAARGHKTARYYLLGKDFGPFKPESKDWRWSTLQLDFAQRSEEMPDATIEAYGFDAFRAGGRAEKIRVDDPIDVEKHKSEVERRDQINRFEQVIMTRADDEENFDIKITGTLYFPGDLCHWAYTRAIEGKDDRFTVWYIDVYGDVFKNGVKIIEGDPTETHPIWPEKESQETLMKQKGANLKVFEQTKRNRVYTEGDNPFDAQKLADARDFRAEIGFFDSDARVYIACDPSFGRVTKRSGEAAILVLADGGQNVPDLIRFVDWWHGKAYTSDFVRRIFEFYHKYAQNCTSVLVEGNVADLGIKKEIREAEQALGRLSKLRYPETKRNKLSYEIGVNTISRELEDENWIINAGGKEGLRMSNELLEQFTLYSPDSKTKDDLVICAWLGISEMRKEKRAAQSKVVYHQAPPWLGSYVGQVN